MSEHSAASALPITGGTVTLYLGAPQGGVNAALNAAMAKLAPKLSKARAGATELDRATQLLPSERAPRRAELRLQAVTAVREYQQVLVNERQRITHLTRTATAVKPSAAVAGHTQLEDIALAQRFASMTVSERTVLTAKCIASPSEHLRWAEVLQRVAPELSGVDPKMREQLRVATLEAFDPELAAAIEVQQAQLEQAERANDIAQQVLAESFIGALQEMQAEPAPVPQPEQVFTVPEHVLADLKNYKFSMRAPTERATQ